MPTLIETILTFLIFLAAALYASVGHAGASGYLAVMALFGIPPEVMKPTALALNILVASVATFKFYRAGYFSWALFWPFALTSIPLAFLGGMLTLPAQWYRPVVGAVLLYAAARLAFGGATPGAAPQPIRRGWALLFGALIGLLSGLTGVGGGIFLSPLLLFLRWSDLRQTASVSAAFILVNSIAGLLGQLSRIPSLPAALPFWGAAALLGGWIGAEYGSRQLGSRALRLLLAVVLVIAGAKMILS